MIPVSTFEGKRVAVFGLGGSGLTTARALLDGGADILADDDNGKSRDQASKAGIPTGSLRDADWSGFEALVLAPGVPLTHPEPHWSVRLAQQNDVEIIGDIELFCRERQRHCANSMFVAITGTNGKSTTTALIGHIFKQAGRNVQIGGNIGTAILDLVPPSVDTVHVIECSSYQIDLTPSLDPSIGVILNVSPDHIDRHGTLEHYSSVKERLIVGSQTAIVGVDDAICSAMADRFESSADLTSGVEKETLARRLVRVSTGAAIDTGLLFKGTGVYEIESNAETKVSDLSGIGSLRGIHNGQNAAAAYAVCRAAGLSPVEINAGLNSFPGLTHRMEEIGKIGHVLFVNDSKATNAEAAERSLSSFERIYWLAGGRKKEGGVTSLVRYGSRIAKAYLFGEAEQDFERTLTGYCPVAVCGTLDNALRAAFRDAKSDIAEEPVVLLAPACASFDQFPNFELRGEAFREGFVALNSADGSTRGGS